MAAEEPSGPWPIAAVERDTGLSKDTLRIWERRYGFPQPLRDAQGERVYPLEQVLRLRRIQRLLDAGHRPGKLLALPPEELDALADGVALPRAAAARPAGDVLTPWLALLTAHDGPGLRRGLQQALLALGLERFVVERVGPLNVAVGEAWMRGELTVAQEHVYTECVHQVLRQAVGGLPEPAPRAPRVLLATLPQEGHGLGLLMAEAMLSLHGCRCVSLGVKVPLDGVVVAAEVTGADIVGLSFTGSFNAAQALAALAELRRRLPAACALWAGGGGLALRRRLPPGIEPVPDISLVPTLLARWRHPSDMTAP